MTSKPLSRETPSDAAGHVRSSSTEPWSSKPIREPPPVLQRVPGTSRLPLPVQRRTEPATIGSRAAPRVTESATVSRIDSATLRARPGTDSEETYPEPRATPALVYDRDSVYRFGAFELDLTRCELRRDGRRVRLEPKPFAVLAHLVANSHRVVSAEELFEVFWVGEHATHNSLYRCMWAVRRAIGDDGAHQKQVVTVRSMGFRFVGSVTLEPRSSRGASPTLLPLPLSVLQEGEESRRIRARVSRLLTQRNRVYLVVGDLDPEVAMAELAGNG